MPRNRRFPGWLIALVLLVSFVPCTASAEGLFSATVDRLSSSDIEFQRRVSNAPFTPIAYLGARRYGNARLVDDRSGETLNFQQTNLSAYAALPGWVGQRDAVFAGGWLSHSRFSADEPSAEDFTVDSVGVAAGWLRQVQPRWQAAAFMLPIGHRSSLGDSDWSLQTMGGASARYIQRDDLWWAFGVFANAGPYERYVLPYVGASWVINPRWTLSAVMPWPALLYAPSGDWFFRLGASPSGASWTVNSRSEEVAVSLESWNFGVTAERRLAGPLWGALEGGVRGLRGLRLDTRDATVDTPDFRGGRSGYVALSLRLRLR